MSLPPHPGPASIVATPWSRRLVAVLVVGLAAGVGGIALSWLLHAVQHLAFGYRGDGPDGRETFLEGVGAASDLRRLAALVACGLVAGLGWWALDRFAAPRVGIARALDADPPRLPVATTIGHALLQIVTVGLGSPLGREVAPRELGATFAGWWSGRVGLDADTSRIVLACGAGAGLAAVYDVPWAGAVFTLEVLLRTFAWTAVWPACTTAFVATAVARVVLGDVAQYAVPPFGVDASLVAWSIVAGPPIGLAAWSFRRLGEAAQARTAAGGWHRVVRCIAVFVFIGVLAGPFPEVLGNGKGPAQLAFGGGLATGTAALVLVLKVVVVTAALRVGAHGGLLTPGLSCGALLAIVLGAAWSLVWPGPAVGAYALVGAAAFLATSMAMPATAILLVFEFTRIDVAFVIPIGVAVAGSVACGRLCRAVAERWAR